MATLNTLRTRGGIIVSAVIGIALLAFVMGDLASSTDRITNARKMRVGEIDGRKIGYIEFSDQMEYFSAVERYMSGKESLSAEEQDAVREMAWQNIIAKYSLLPGFERMGISVSESEQIDMVNGEYISPVISGTFTNPQTGLFDHSRLSAFVSNMNQDPSGRAVFLWNYLKDQMNRQRLLSKYMIMVSKGMFVTDLEVERGVANANTVSDASYLVKEYSLVPDSTVKVTDSEIRKFYNDHRNMFRQVASRNIEYVVFNVFPSEEDYREADKYISEMAGEFAATPNPFQYAMRYSQTQPNKMFLSEKQLNGELAAFAFGPHSGEMFGPEKQGDTYVLTRVSETRMLPDSIGARHILLQESQVQTADSIVIALRKGASFGELAVQYSLDQASALQGGDLGVFDPEMMVPDFANGIVNAKRGDIVTVKTPYGLHIVEITYKSQPVKKVQLAQIFYKVEPSDVTQRGIYDAASKFLTASSGSLDRFNTAVTEQGLSKRVAQIRSSDRNVSGMDNSRELVRWAFNSQQGAVSGIIENNGDYLIAAVTGALEDGIAPVEKVSAEIAARLRFEKKGEMLAQQMAGSSSLSEAASKLGAEIQQAQGVTFNTFYIDGAGVELQLIGGISAAQPQVLSRPVKGSSGVFLFTVDSRATADNTDAANERVRLEAAAQTYIGERINQALIEVSQVKDMRVKFF